MAGIQIQIRVIVLTWKFVELNVCSRYHHEEGQVYQWKKERPWRWELDDV